MVATICYLITCRCLWCGASSPLFRPFIYFEILNNTWKYHTLHYLVLSLFTLIFESIGWWLFWSPVQLSGTIRSDSQILASVFELRISEMSGLYSISTIFDLKQNSHFVMWYYRVINSVILLIMAWVIIGWGGGQLWESRSQLCHVDTDQAASGGRVVERNGEAAHAADWWRQVPVVPNASSRPQSTSRHCHVTAHTQSHTHTRRMLLF